MASKTDLLLCVSDRFGIRYLLLPYPLSLSLSSSWLRLSRNDSVKLCATSLGGSADINSIAPSGSAYAEWE